MHLPTPAFLCFFSNRHSIGPLTFENLEHGSKAALRLVRKDVKQAVDVVIRRLTVRGDEFVLSIDAVNTLLNAVWDLEQLELGIDCRNYVVSRELLLSGVRNWPKLRILKVLPYLMAS